MRFPPVQIFPADTNNAKTTKKGEMAGLIWAEMEICCLLSAVFQAKLVNFAIVTIVWFRHLSITDNKT